jgi:hypothetical protein
MRVLLLIVLSFACQVRRVAVSQLAPTLARGARALESEPDLEIAKSAIPATLKQTEALLETAPDDRVLLDSAAQGSLEYAFGILLDELESLPKSAHEKRRVLISRATAMYDRTLVYSGRSLAQLDKRFPDALAGDPEALRAAAAHIDKRGARALLFAGMAIASAADLDRGDFSRLVDLPKAIVLLERAHALDPDDFHAGAAMTLGLIYASPAMAGERTRSQEYFNEAIRRTDGKFLLIQGLMARTLYVDRGDREGFRSTLKEILDTPENVDPDARLANVLARRRAARDLAHEEDFFA